MHYDCVLQALEADPTEPALQLLVEEWHMEDVDLDEL